jgi:predicted lipoprotein with Yx(FWY)xxD motif
MRRILSCAVLAAIAAMAWAGSGLADSNYGPLKTMQTAMGTVLTDSNGMTLYTLDKDKKNKSTCTGSCATHWPPAMAPSNAKPVGELSLVKRADGKLQWADKGKPLYTYADDKKPGDVNGDGKGGIWHVVKE